MLTPRYLFATSSFFRRMCNYCFWRRRQPGTTAGSGSAASSSPAAVEMAHGNKPDSEGIALLPA
jgi:hypothetical protein